MESGRAVIVDRPACLLRLLLCVRSNLFWVIRLPNGISKPYNVTGSDRSPRLGGGFGVGPICKRGFAASPTTDGDVNPFANLIRYKVVDSYLIGQKASLMPAVKLAPYSGYHG